jgi:hypothetical protein
MKRFVYLIKNEDNGYIKIGIGKNVEQRIKSLQTGSTAKLRIIYKKEVQFASKIESLLHRRYENFRVHGEWFDINEELMEEIDKQISITENSYKILSELENPFIK